MSYIHKVAERISRSSYIIHKGDEFRNFYGQTRDNCTRRLLQPREIEQLSDAELREASLEKLPNGCATKSALKAQRILYDRLHDWGF